MNVMQSYNDWCKSFLEQPTAPMGQYVRLCFVRSYFMDSHPASTSVPPDLEQSVAYRMVDLRAAQVGLVTTPAVKTLLSCLCITPAHCVMYVSILRYVQINDPRAVPLTMSNMSELFSNGFPSDTQLDEMRDRQKMINDVTQTTCNMLDLVMQYLPNAAPEGVSGDEK